MSLMIFNLSLLLIAILCWGNLIRLSEVSMYDIEVFGSILLLGACLGIIVNNIVKLIMGQFLDQKTKNKFQNNNEWT